MDFMTAVKTCVVKKYVCFDGRASRSEYWYFTLCYALVSFFGTFILALINVNLANIFSMLLMLAVLLPHLGVSIRRLHDDDLSGWWLLLALTGIGYIVILYWLIIKGTDGPNRFGPDSVIVDIEDNLAG